MTPRGRTWIALAGVAVIVVALGAYRAASTPATTQGAERHASESSDEPLPTLLDFGRGECVPCQKMMPVLETLARQQDGHVRVRYLDLSEPDNLERAKQLRVRVIPTQVLIDADGSEVARHEGFWALADIEARLVELGWTPAR